MGKSKSRSRTATTVVSAAVALYAAGLATYIEFFKRPPPEKPTLEVTKQPVELNVSLGTFLARHESGIHQRAIYSDLSRKTIGVSYVADGEAQEVETGQCILDWHVHDGATTKAIELPGASGQKSLQATRRACVFSTFFWVALPSTDSMFVIVRLADTRGKGLDIARTNLLELAHPPRG